MKADFSGWATKADIKCSDGLTIAPKAFIEQDEMQVPLVWQHGHTDPDNVLGHAILQHRPEGVYCYGFFNDTAKADTTKKLLIHKDINSMSIWANQLVKRSSRVMHGVIKEVSLVLSGANPGAIIENVNIRHSDGEVEILDEDVIIKLGLELEHDDLKDDVVEEKPEEDTETQQTETVNKDDATHGDKPEVGKETQQVETVVEDDAIHDDDPNETVGDVYDTLTEKQKDLVSVLIQEAVDELSAEHTDMTDKDKEAITGEEESETMTHTNLFETATTTKDTKVNEFTLSHDDLNEIVANAKKSGTLKDAFEDYVLVHADDPEFLAHGITSVENLFPEARLVNDTPEFRKRRTEWVNVVLEGVTKNPFSKIKTLSADITYEDARAKGYVKGSMKKEEYFPIATRTTGPTTVYKKQKLDRDDVLDITEFDVVVWLKGEMRVMLDEEVARAILIGDGRDVSHDDKINEQNIRPIAKDNELFTTTVNVNIDDANSSVAEIVDAIILNRKHLRGSGQPSFFTSETIISQFMILKDTTGRRIYRNLEELASELRVKEIVAVEAMEEDPTLIGVMVNLADYTLGADKGGQVTMFDDFNIDYNKLIYLIETRASGALTKLKSALVIKKVAGSVTLITPTEPSFDAITGVVTIPTQTGVTYKDAGNSTLSPGPQTAISAGATVIIHAIPSGGTYDFNNNADDEWAFTRESA